VLGMEGSGKEMWAWMSLFRWRRSVSVVEKGINKMVGVSKG
jgi:hypothetical protein